MRILLCVVLTAGVAVTAMAADKADSLITPETLMESIKTLAADEWAGRLPGTAGYDQAAKWGADRFARAGLEPGGEDGFFQHLEMEVNEIDAASLTLFGPDGEAKALALGEEFTCRGFSGSGAVDAEIVFAGYGLSLPERGYDDYAGIDVEGKIVLVFKQAPSWKPADGEGWGDAHLPRPKAAAARAHGATGLLMVPRPLDDRPQPPICSVLHGPGEYVADLPAAQISVEAAEILAGGWEELRRLQGGIDEVRRPMSQRLGARAKFTVTARYRPAADTFNVVGLLPGSDPEYKDECLVIGAHLDHVGSQGDVYWPGANDNASGAAAVVHIAEAFAASGEAPARTVVFVLFAGEEQGLYGAKFHAEHPVVPLDRTAAMFNLDCVAHGDSISLGGGKSQPVLWEMARATDREHAGLSVTRSWRGGGADAHPFWEKGVPTLYFATKNSYTHLHQVGDTPETLNPGLYAEVVRLAYRAAREVAMGRYERETIQEGS